MTNFRIPILVLVAVTISLTGTLGWGQVERVNQLSYSPLPEIKIPEPTIEARRASEEFHLDRDLPEDRGVADASFRRNPSRTDALLRDSTGNP